MDFEAINRLRLKEAFGEFELFQRISKDEDWLDILFECDTRGQLFVYDDADVGHVVYVNDTKGITADVMNLTITHQLVRPIHLATPFMAITQLVMFL